MGTKQQGLAEPPKLKTSKIKVSEKRVIERKGYSFPEAGEMTGRLRSSVLGLTLAIATWLCSLRDLSLDWNLITMLI